MFIRNRTLLAVNHQLAGGTDQTSKRCNFHVHQCELSPSFFANCIILFASIRCLRKQMSRNCRECCFLYLLTFVTLLNATLQIQVHNLLSLGFHLYPWNRIVQSLPSMDDPHQNLRINVVKKVCCTDHECGNKSSCYKWEVIKTPDTGGNVLP